MELLKHYLFNKRNFDIIRYIMQNLDNFAKILILLGCFFQALWLTQTTDICLKHDQTGLKRNCVVIGDILRVIQNFSPLMCMRECLMFPLCRSVNIYPDWLQCELMLQTSKDGSDGFVTSFVGITIDAVDIPLEYAGVCQGHNCLLNERCIGMQSRGYTCVQYDFCDGLPPLIVNTSYIIDSSQGVPVAVYSCLPGAVYIGGTPKSFCNPLTRVWSQADIICSMSLPDGCGTPPSPSVPHNITRMYEADSYLAVFTCLSFNGQIPLDHCPITRCTGIEQWTSIPNVSCSVKDCYANGGYDGHVTCTNTGKTCQRWDQQSPHVHTYFMDRSDLHNYCRINDTVIPWCYTMDPATRWEYCPVPSC